MTTQTFTLSTLPFKETSLAPYMSKKTLSYHHGKHHAAYVDNLNKLVANTEFADKSLEQIILLTHEDKTKIPVFNNAAQTWNHSFFWNSITHRRKRKPTGALLEKLIETFNSYEHFIEMFKIEGLGQFGSGWVWLVLDPNDKALRIIKTSNAANPLTHNLIPLLTCDVWEHAYYLDYKNDRGKYLDIFLNHLINWKFAEKNFNNE